MTELRSIPKVIAALDVGVPRAIDLIGRLDGRQQDVAIQLRGSMLMTHGDHLIELARRRGFYTILNCHLTDTPEKQAFDINTLIEHRAFGDRDRPLPDAITLEPTVSYSPNDYETLGQAIVRAKQQGVAVIGNPRSYNFSPGDSDHFANQAVMTESAALQLGISALEVVYNGLKTFREHRKTGYGMGQIVVSKISQALNGENLADASQNAFNLGATSILLGSAISGRDVDNQIEIVDSVVLAYERSVNS